MHSPVDGIASDCIEVVMRQVDHTPGAIVHLCQDGLILASTGLLLPGDFQYFHRLGGG